MTTLQDPNEGLPIVRRAASGSGVGPSELPLQSMVSAWHNQTIEWIKRTPQSRIRLGEQDSRHARASANLYLRDRPVRLNMDVIFEVRPAEQDVCRHLTWRRLYTDTEINV
jgi:hypothetical protein